MTAHKYTNSSYISTYDLQFQAAVFRVGKSMTHFSDSRHLSQKPKPCCLMKPNANSQNSRSTSLEVLKANPDTPM